MQHPPSIRVVLFGLDHVLVDVRPSTLRALTETAYFHSGIELTDALYTDYRLQSGHHEPRRLVYKMVQDAGMNVSMHRVIEDFDRRYRGERWNGYIKDEVPLVRPMVLSTVQRGRILGIVSIRRDTEVRFSLERHGWKAFFPLIVALEQQERRLKPEPNAHLRALAMLAEVGEKVLPEEVAVVGECGDDMVAARAAGMWALGVIPPYGEARIHDRHLERHGAHHVMRSLNELPRLLDTLTQPREDDTAAAA